MNSVRNYSQFHTICNKIGKSKEFIVNSFTKGRTDSLRALSDTEFDALMVEMEKFNKVPAGDPMRKKMISLARKMHWGETTKEIISRLDGWLMKQKFQKTLMQLDVPQLTRMVTIFEQKVYADYLTGLNK